MPSYTYQLPAYIPYQPAPADAFAPHMPQSTVHHPRVAHRLHHDAMIVAILRNRFRASREVVNASDATLIAAFTCWRVCGNADWQTLPALTCPMLRSRVWSDHMHTMNRDNE